MIHTKKTQRKVLFFLCLICVLSSTVATTTLAQQKFQVFEGETVSLAVDAQDPDNDILTTTYSWPLDKNGRWQTGFNDAGKYPITITVSDGKARTEEEILLIVANTNRAPIIKGQNINIYENSTLEATLPSKDEDGQIIQYSFDKHFTQNKEKSNSASSTFTWTPSFQDAGIHIVKVAANDGEDTSTAKFILNVVDVPQKLTLEKITKQINEGDRVTIALQETDKDQNKIIYSPAMALPQGMSLTKNILIWDVPHTAVLDPQRKAQQSILLFATTKNDQQIQRIDLTVLAKNKAPQIIYPREVKVNEGEIIYITPEIIDEDGDQTRTHIEHGDFTMFIPYDSPEKVYVTIVASDGKETVKQNVTININNVNRMPQLTKKSYVLQEGSYQIPLQITDKDSDDEIKVTLVASHNKSNSEKDLFIVNNTLVLNAHYDASTAQTSLLGKAYNAIASKDFTYNKINIPITISDGHTTVNEEVEITVLPKQNK